MDEEDFKRNAAVSNEKMRRKKFTPEDKAIAYAAIRIAELEEMVGELEARIEFDKVTDEVLDRVSKFRSWVK